jgi:hypothetical protein
MRAKDRRRMEVSTVSRVGDQDVIRTMPIMQVKMALAAGYKTSRSYPPYDPVLAVAEDLASPPPQANAPQIYGTKAESDMMLKTVDFDVSRPPSTKEATCRPTRWRRSYETRRQF